MMDFREILVGGTKYKDLCQMPLELKNLKNHPWIGLARGTATYELYNDFFLRNNTDISLDIGFVPKQLALPLLETGKLVQVQINCTVPRRQIQLVSDKGRGKSLAADTFYKYLKNN